MGALESITAPVVHFRSPGPRHMFDSRRDSLPREHNWVPDTETTVPKAKGESAPLMVADFVSAESPVT